MSLYVPAETLVYAETEDLPQLVSGLTSTDAWKALAPAANLEGRLEQITGLSRIPFYTGLGGAAAVTFSRAQIGVAVLGFETSETQEGFRVKPQIALVIATHAGEKQALEVSENLVGQFARQNLGAAQFERIEREGATLRRWSAAANASRTLYSTAEGEFVVVGNDETAVLGCLQTIRGQRASLGNSSQLKLMRQKMAGDGASAFGYVSPEGLAQLIESLARAYIERATDQRAQGLAASLLPQLAGKILGPDGAGWSARFDGGAVEDRYAISLQPGMANLLGEAAKIPATDQAPAAALLPGDTYQLTTYLYAEPAAAWLNFNNAVTARLDTLSAVIVKELLKESLQPYGIAAPQDFLRAVGPAPVVARIDSAGASTVTIVAPENQNALRQFVTKHLGARTRTVRVGEAELLVSADAERGAASFVDNLLLIGPEAALRRCLVARAGGATLGGADNFRRARQFAAQEIWDSATYTDDRDAAYSLVAALLPSPAARAEFTSRREAAQRTGGDWLGQIPYAVTLTRFSDDGVERRTRSSFGQFGTIVAQLTAEQR